MAMKNLYSRVEDINKWKNRTMIYSSVILLVITICEKYQVAINYPQLKDYVQFLVTINLIFIVLYIFLDSRSTYIFNKAERNRRLQYLDNSFDTNFAGEKIQDYFSQENINHGFLKLAINCFENTFHTFNIVYKMQLKTYAKALIVIAIFLFSAIAGNKDVIRLLIEAILPLVLLQDAIKTIIFINRLENLLEGFKGFFTAIKADSFNKREPEAMKFVIEYETTLAWASLPTDSKIFIKNRTNLANEWENLKTEYNLNITV